MSFPRAGSRVRNCRSEIGIALSTFLGSMRAKGCQFGERRGGFIRMIRADGSNGIAAISSGAACQMRTIGRSGDGRRYGGTSDRFSAIVNRVIWIVVGDKGKRYCTGRMIVARSELHRRLATGINQPCRRAVQPPAQPIGAACCRSAASPVSTAAAPSASTKRFARPFTWQDGHGQPGGCADAARRLDEAHKLLDEVGNMLTEMRRTMRAPSPGDVAGQRLGEFGPDGAKDCGSWLGATRERPSACPG